MKAQITINMDNAAFDETPASELGRILRRLAADIEAGELVPIILRDINGNRVGSFTLEV